MENWHDEEKKLYAQARALKMKAREMRKTRLEKESENATKQALLQKHIDELALKRKQKQEEKLDRDARIRRAFLRFMDALKDEKLALLVYGAYGDKKHVLTVVDRKVPNARGIFPSSIEYGAAQSTDTNIRLVAGKGFEWD